MNSGQQSPSSADPSAFATELRVRVVEAATSLEAAEVLGEPLIAQIAEADLADLRAMAVRNDIELTEPPL
ncbi:MAG: hypothetical protein WD794_07955 [Mycobacteriales bacterium]